MPTSRALFRVNFDVCQRSRGGDAVKLAAYNMCGRLQHGGKIYDFRRKAGEHVGTTILMTPPGYPRDAMPNPGALWRAAEAAENRGNSQTARQILITIPREIPSHRRADFIRHLCRPLVSDGMALQIDIHDPGARDDDEQPHAHVLATMREFDGPTFAKSKVRGRDWNKMFTESRGREMRSRIAGGMNEWFEANGIDCRVDARSNAEIDGADALPSEPQVAREATEIEKRNPGSSVEIIKLDRHRAQRRAVQKLDREIADAEAESANIKRRQQERRGQQGRTTTMPTTHINQPWMAQAGGADSLSPQHLASAKRSYEKWRDAQLKRGRKAQQILPFAEYVSFVQDKQTARGPLPADNKDAAFARASKRDADSDAGWTRRKRFLANLLAEHYDVSELGLDVASNIKRIRLDRNARTATVYLADGSHFIDYGDRIAFHGNIAQPSAAEIAAAAERHQWTSVKLTGSVAFRDEVGIALALREPPIAHDHILSPAAAARLERLLAERAPNTINPSPETADAQPDANSIRPAAPARAGGSAPAAPDGRPTGGSGGPVLALSGDGDGADNHHLDTAPPADAAADTDTGGSGIADADDDEILPALLSWLEPRVASAEATMRRRPESQLGLTRAAMASQARRAEFDASELARRATTILAVRDALNAEPPDAGLLDAVRRSGDPFAAEEEMRRRQEQELARKNGIEPDEPEQDEVARPRI